MASLNAVIRRRATSAVRIVAEQARVRAAFVFGSHVEGKPDKYSDIDLAVFVEGAEKWDIFRRVEVAGGVRDKVGNDLELHFFAAADLKAAEPASFARYVIRHGVRIKETPAYGTKERAARPGKRQPAAGR